MIVKSLSIENSEMIIVKVHVIFIVEAEIFFVLFSFFTIQIEKISV